MEQTQTVGVVAEHSRCVVVALPQSVVAVPAAHMWPIFNAGISAETEYEDEAFLNKRQ